MPNRNAAATATTNAEVSSTAWISNPGRMAAVISKETMSTTHKTARR